MEVLSSWLGVSRPCPLLKEISYQDMLELPTSTLWQARLCLNEDCNQRSLDPAKVPKSKKDKKLEPEEHEELKQSWDNGISKRYNDDYKKWLQAGIMNDQYLQAGNISTRISRKRRRSQSLPWHLALGREVAVKVFEATDFAST